MSSTSNLVVVIQSAVIYLYKIGGPILMFIGTIGSILNLIVFSQKTLQKSPCSIYFIAYNLANFLYIFSSLLSLTLDVGYSIDPSACSLVICRLRLYFAIVFNCLSPFYLILTSIDRILITSPNALTRQRSTRRLAYLCITLGTLFWCLFHSHALIFTNIMQMSPNYFLCYFQPGVYFVFVGYYALLKEIFGLLLMIICGLWAIKNIGRVRRVGVGPSVSASGTTAASQLPSTCSKDRQLVLMLLMDISIYTLFSFVFGIFLMYQQITEHFLKTIERVQIENVIRNLCLFIIGIPFCSSCYANLIVSKTYRKEVKKIFLQRRFFCRH